MTDHAIFWPLAPYTVQLSIAISNLYFFYHLCMNELSFLGDGIDKCQNISIFLEKML